MVKPVLADFIGHFGAAESFEPNIDILSPHTVDTVCEC